MMMCTSFTLQIIKSHLLSALSSILNNIRITAFKNIITHFVIVLYCHLY